MQVFTGRVFVVLIAVVAYLIAMRMPQSIFDVATQYAFAGYSALSPLLVAALFWRRSTKWGALASTVWTAVAIVGVAWIQQTIPPPPPGVMVPVWSAFGVDVVTRAAQGAMVCGMLPVVPMTLDLRPADDRRLAVDAWRTARRSNPGAISGVNYWALGFCLQVIRLTLPEGRAPKPEGQPESVDPEVRDVRSLEPYLCPPTPTTPPSASDARPVADLCDGRDRVRVRHLQDPDAAAHRAAGAPRADRRGAGSPEFQIWVGRLFYIPAFAGGIFGLLGGYLTDLFGRRRVLTFSILIYAIAAFLSGFSTSVGSCSSCAA